MGVVSVLENECSTSLETKDQSKPKDNEQDRSTSLNDPIVVSMKENTEESCDANLESKNENMDLASPLSGKVETNSIVSRRHKLKRDVKPNGILTPDEKSIALEERKLANEERKLAIQEKKIAIEEKKLLIESQKIALLKEKQNMSNNVGLGNQCDQSDDAESPLRERTNVFEVLMSFKQHSAVTSTTENIVIKEKPKEVEDIDSKINSKNKKKIVKDRLEELADKKLNKHTGKSRRSTERDSLKGEKLSKTKRILLVSESDEEGSSQGKVIAVDVIPGSDDCLPMLSSNTSVSKSPKSIPKKNGKNNRLILMSEEESDDAVLKEHSTKATKSKQKSSLKQSKLKLKRDSESDSSPPPNEKKRNSLFNYFNSVSKKEVNSVTPEKINVETNDESSPIITEQKSATADTMSACARKSKLKLQPAIVLRPLELELTGNQLNEAKPMKTNSSGCRRSPRKKESTPTKLSVEGKDSKLSAQEKINTKPKSSKKPWQMRIKPPSSTPVMDLFTKVLSDEEDLVIDDESDSEDSIFITKKRTISSKDDLKQSSSKEVKSPIVAKKLQDTNQTPSKEPGSPIVADKSGVKKGKSPRAAKKSRVQDTDQSPSKKARSPIIAKKSKLQIKTQNQAPLKEADIPAVTKKSRVKETKSPIVAKKSRLQDTNQGPTKKVSMKPQVILNKLKSSKVEPCSTSKSTSETVIDKRERKCKTKVQNTVEMTSDDSDLDIQIVETKKSTSKAPLKLAPLFMKKQQTPKEVKPTVDPSILEARQRFLKSGVPDCVKKITEIIFRDEPEDTVFPTLGTSHVTQQDSSEIWHLPKSDLKLSPVIHEEPLVLVKSIPVGSFVSNMTTAGSILNRPSRPHPIDPDVCRTLVKSLKLENPNFPYPMYRMFKLLRDKNVKLQQGEGSSRVDVDKKKKNTSRLSRKRKRVISDSDEETKRESQVSDNRFLMWTEKYRPLSGDEVVGNKNCVKQLKLWLESWKKFRNCDNPKTLGRKRKKANSSSEDEFINDSSDDDANENMPGNTAILYGPHGCGKTSAVYALANELGFEVLESNASTKRTGKCLLAEFQGATQIHRLCSKSEQGGGVDKFLKTGKSKKKPVRKETPAEKDGSANSKMSIVLIDDADIVFEDHDEGFTAALATLVTTSRRPIIFIANNTECAHLSRFYEGSLVLNLVKPEIRHTSIWLQLICLVEGIRASNDALQRLLKFYNGDISRSLLQLQVWTLSGGNNLPKLADSNTFSKNKPLSNKVDLEDDDSNSSWVDSQGISGDCDTIPIHEECIEKFIGNEMNLCPFPADLSELWWNLAPMLSMPEMKPKRPTIIKQCESSELPKELYDQLRSEYCGTDDEGSPKKAPNEMNAEVTDMMDTNVSEQCTHEPSGDIPVATDSHHKSMPKSQCTHSEMEVVMKLMDSLSAMDVLATNPRLNGDAYDVRLCQRVWEREAIDGVTTDQNYRPCWNQDEFVSRSVVHFVAKGSIHRCRQTLQTCSASGSKTRYDPILPTEEIIKWRYDQQAADNTIVDLVPLGQLPDHRAIFTDYIPALQSICSHEMRRLERNTTRMNRFFHYLKGLGIHASDETLNVLASSFRGGLWQVGD